MQNGIIICTMFCSSVLRR